jgi:uncharacterized membrane protein YbhN (UPF0104 family)
LKIIQKYKKPLAIALKTFILVFAIGFIYNQLSKEDSKEKFLLLQNTITEGNTYLIFIAVLFLMIINWFIEAIKWRRLILKIQPISVGRSFSAIFSGLSIGVFTPNRIGEYGGRILYLEEDHRIQGILITFLGSISQMMVTLITGIFSFIFYFHRFVTFDQPLNYLLIYIGVFFIALLLYLYFNISRFSSYLSSFKLFKKLGKYTSVFSLYHWRDLVPVLLLSLLRYAIFSFQYYVLLKIFIPELILSDSLMMISLIFFVQSILPSFTLAELGVRGAVAVYFFSHITNYSQGVIAAAFSLWLINIILPSLIGIFFVIKANFFGTRT